MGAVTRLSESKATKFRVHYSERGAWRRQRLALYRSNLVVASVLREIRTAQGVTQAEVAKQMKVTGSCICLWEGGHYTVSPDRARSYREAVARIANKGRRSPLK